MYFEAFFSYLICAMNMCIMFYSVTDYFLILKSCIASIMVVNLKKIPQGYYIFEF